jgi:hypothetical protein
MGIMIVLVGVRYNCSTRKDTNIVCCGAGEVHGIAKSRADELQAAYIRTARCNVCSHNLLYNKSKTIARS